MFLQYLRDHRRLLFLLALLVIIFTMVFALYQIPAVPARYAGLLFCAAAVPFAVRDFLQYRRRHHQLTQLCSCDLVLPEELPVSKAIWEQDYQALVLRLCRDRENLQEEIRQIRQETENFYTLWLHQIKTPIAAMSLMLQQSGEPDTAALQQELFKIEQYAGLTLEYQRIGSIAAGHRTATLRTPSPRTSPAVCRKRAGSRHLRLLARSRDCGSLLSSRAGYLRRLHLHPGITSGESGEAHRRISARDPLTKQHLNLTNDNPLMYRYGQSE